MTMGAAVIFLIFLTQPWILQGSPRAGSSRVRSTSLAMQEARPELNPAQSRGMLGGLYCSLCWLSGRAFFITIFSVPVWPGV